MDSRDTSLLDMDGEHCSICLNSLVEKAILDTCFHEFCLVCIKEWSRIKSSCPLCTQNFGAILYNIRSDSDYDELKVRPEPQKEPTAAARIQHTRGSTLTTNAYPWLPSLLNSGHDRRDIRTAARISNDKPSRRTIYRKNLWAKSIQGENDAVRVVSPKFLSKNPACCHRMICWLHRDIRALMGKKDVLLLDSILSTIKKHHIRSETFFKNVFPYFGDKTRHFVHEFHSFATSPYDMEAYDDRVTYGPPTQVADAITLSSDSEVEEIKVVNESRQVAQGPPRRSKRRAGASIQAASEAPCDPCTTLCPIPSSSKMVLACSDEGASQDSLASCSSFENYPLREWERKRKFVFVGEDDGDAVSPNKRLKSQVGLNLIEPSLFRSKLEINAGGTQGDKPFKKHSTGHKNRKRR